VTRCHRCGRTIGPDGQPGEAVQWDGTFTETGECEKCKLKAGGTVEDRDDANPTLWQIRTRVRMLDASIKAHDRTLCEIQGVAKQNTERARKAHDRIDDIVDGELLRELVEQMRVLTERVDRIAEFCTELKKERKATK
jgi:hypothetical protein